MLDNYDTRGRGRVVLRHTPQFVVMTMIECWRGEARSIVQSTLLISGSYLVRSVKLTSTSILAEEGYGGCRHRLGWKDVLVITVEGWVP